MKKIITITVCMLLAMAMLLALPSCKDGGDGDKDTGADAKYTASEGLLVYYIYLVSYNFTEEEMEEHNFLQDDTSLKDMPYDESRSWYDVIVERAADALERLLVYANAADADGVSLDDDENASIESTLVNQRTLAASNGYELDDYLAYIYNNSYITEDVLKAQLELSYLADKYSVMLEEEFWGNLTDDMIEEKLEQTGEESDTSVTRNIANIVLSFDNYDSEEATEAAASELLEKIKSESKLDAEVFEEYAEQYSDSSEIFFTNVAEGDMIETMDDWLYGDAQRAAGDLGIVSSDYGCHIMYFVSEGDPVYIANAKIAVIDDMFAEWYESNRAKYNIGLTEELRDGINLDV